MAINTRYNKALHWTAIPLRSIAASELGRYLERQKRVVPGSSSHPLTGAT